MIFVSTRLVNSTGGLLCAEPVLGERDATSALSGIN